MKASILAASLALLAFGGQVEPVKPKRPVVGDSAPAIRLNDHAGRATSFGGEHETWTVLAFFPKAATPG